MVESGLSPYEVLYAGTHAVAEFNHETWDYGSVAVGQRADLVLLNADPTEQVAHFADRAGVMVNGQWLTAAQIEAELQAIAARYAGS